MFIVFKRELKANLKSLMFWCIGMIAMAGMGFGEYYVVKQTDDAFMNIVDVFPRIVKVMMGFGVIPINTPEGYLACMFLFLAMIAFLHSALIGAAIISKEERDKTAEFLYTKPVKRSTVINGKILAAFVNTAVITLAAWGTTCAAWLPQLDDKRIIKEINMLILGMFIVQIVFMSIGLYLSSIFKDHKKASLYSAVFVLGAYFLSIIIDVLGKIDFLTILTPFKYFDPAKVILSGYNYIYIVFSFAIASIAIFFTYILHNKRDLRN